MPKRISPAEELLFQNRSSASFMQPLPPSTYQAPDDPESDVTSRGANNHPPVANNDTNGKDRVIEDDGRGHGDPVAKGNVLANDTDKDHDTLKVLKPGTFEGDYGTLKLSANGKWTYTLDDDNPKVDALGDGDKLFDSFKYTATDGHGGKDTATLKIKIEGSDDPPAASIKLDAVTADNVVNSAEANADVNITGTVGGDVKDGDIVTVTVNGTDFEGVASGGLFSIAVSGFQLSVDGDLKIEASVTTGEDGNTTTANASKTYAVDVTPPVATITLDAVTSDNVVNAAEGASTVAITGVVGGDVKNGDMVTLVVNGTSYTGVANAGQFSIDVAGADLLADSDKVIQASVTTADGAGNMTTVVDTQSYSTDATPPVATIALDAITANGIVERTESASEVIVTGSVSGDTKNGDVISLVVNGHTFSGTVVSNNFSIAVAGADLLADADKVVDAKITVSDAAGNTQTFGDTHGYSIDLNFDLSVLAATQGFIIQGPNDADFLGSSVALAGDVNGDGFADIIIGAPNISAQFEGDAYVIFGSSAGFGVPDGSGHAILDLSTLGPSRGFIVQGDMPGDKAGLSVHSAGDVNGDGFDDMIVGAPAGDDGGTDAGEAYIVFGSAAGFGTVSGGRSVVDLTTLSASEGFIIQGDMASDDAGRSVSSAGDINGDGFDDIIVGAPQGDDGATDAGEAYVIFGSTTGFGTDVSGRDVIDLTSLTSLQGFVIQGDVDDNQAGETVSSAGDVNGDGFEDVFVGAAFADSNGDGYVVFGSSGGFGTNVAGRQVVDLTYLSAAQGFILRGESSGDHLGASVSQAGDVNGDGFDDIIIGAPQNDNNGDGAGAVYVVFGSAGGFGSLDMAGRAIVDVANLSSSQGFSMWGDQAYDQAGFSVSSAGDINGDGLDDLLVGAEGASFDGPNSGEAYLVFGSKNGFGITAGGQSSLYLSTLTSAQGFKIQGDATGDRAGWSVSSAGDVNGDGYDDLMVGARSAKAGGNLRGETYVIYGGAFTGNDPITQTGTTAAEMLIGGLGADTLTGGGGADIIRSGAGNDTIGVTGTDFVKIDGGSGYDTLRIDGASDVFDFATIKNTAVDSIEAIDMGVVGSQSLSLSKLDLFHLSDDTSGGMTRLTIHGGAGDTVSATDAGWTANGTTTIGSDTFRIFDNGHAELLVDSDITLSGVLGDL